MKKISNSASNIKDMIFDLVQKFIQFMKSVYDRIVDTIMNLGNRIVKNEKNQLDKKISSLEEVHVTFSLVTNYHIDSFIASIKECVDNILVYFKEIQNISTKPDTENSIERYKKYTAVLKKVSSDFYKLNDLKMTYLDEDEPKKIITKEVTYSMLLKIKSDVDSMYSNINELGRVFKKSGKLFSNKVSKDYNKNIKDNLTEEQSKEFLDVFKDFSTVVKYMPNMYRILIKYESRIIKDLNNSLANYK